jgi:N-hydroxyarylamine O-acetyltransferase
MTPATFAVEPYLARIGVAHPQTADLTALRALQLAHRIAIPFENLDIQLGRPVRLDIESLQEKLVGARRGGYCFEQNTLFLHALRALGFEVEPCEARVRPPGTTVLTPRTHMVLLARVDGSDWLLDVGFGAGGPLEPVALSAEPQDQFGWTYRVVREEQTHVLQFRGAEGWEDLYAFVPEPRVAVDFEVANWYTSTHPESLFVRTLTAQRATPEARHVLRGLTYTRSTPSRGTSREITRDELVPFLADTFGIDLPAGARFQALDGDG